MKVKRTERGWGGHFICVDRCLFRRNTLLEYKNDKVVVSTVGAMVDIHAKNYPNRIQFDTIGYNRYYETMVFKANLKDTRYYDIDVEQQISFYSNWSIDHLNADDEANNMHETVVNEITEMLLTGKAKEDK